MKILPLAVAVGGIGLAWLFYIQAPGLPGRLATRFQGTYLFLLNKWYFDELYDRLFVNPAKRLGRALWLGGDGSLIDGVGPDGHRCGGVYAARLNPVVPVVFVPGVGGAAPPWDGTRSAGAWVVLPVGVVPAGRITDPVGRRPAMIIGTLLAGVAVIAIPFAPNLVVLVIILCGYGVAAAFLGEPVTPVPVLGVVVIGVGVVGAIAAHRHVAKGHDGVVLNVEAAAGLVEGVVVGEGSRADSGDVVTVHYTGWLPTGRKFDSSRDRDRPFPVAIGYGRVIKGWDQGVAGMKVGGRRELTIPPNLAYGPAGAPPSIGPNETLIFVVVLVAVK